jgi:hypothetical protein
MVYKIRSKRVEMKCTWMYVLFFFTQSDACLLYLVQLME